MDVNEHTFYGVNPGSSAMVVYADAEGFVTCACGELILVAPADRMSRVVLEELKRLNDILQALKLDPETIALLRLLRNLDGLYTTEENGNG